MPQFDQAAVEALQRAFAGHVLTLRGSLPNASLAAEPRVDQLVLKGHRDNGEVDVKDLIELEDLVPTPPLAAFVGRLPMEIHAHYLGNQGYRVALTVPAGIQPGKGAVRLQWPTRTIPAVPPLRLPKPSVYQAFDLLVREGAVGTKVRVGQFDACPIEVEFGDRSVPENEFEYENGRLVATVPINTGNVRIRVTTADGKHYRSKGRFLSYYPFDLIDKEGEANQEVRIGKFDYEPSRVSFLDSNGDGGDVPKDQFRFSDGVLYLTVPQEMPVDYRAKVAVQIIPDQSHDRLYLSNQFFRRRGALG